MKIYSKYIINSLSKVFLMIAATLTTVVVLIQLLGFINHNLIGEIGIYNILKFITLESTNIFLYISPIALTCAILYMYNAFVIDNEFIILESSGVSRYELALPAIIFATALTLLSYFVAMVIDPLAKRESSAHKNSLINAAMFSSILEEKVFNKVSKDLMVYVNQQDQQDQLKGIAIYDNRSAGNKITIFAERAEIFNNDDRIIFKLYNGSRQEVVKDALRTLYFNTLSLPISLEKIKHQGGNLSDREKIITDLITAKIKNPKLNDGVTKEINHRFSYPLLNLSLACICLATIFSGTFDRKWKAKKTMKAVIFSVLSIACVLALKNKETHSIMFILLLYLTIIGFICSCIHILRKNSDNVEAVPRYIKSKLPVKLREFLF